VQSSSLLCYVSEALQANINSLRATVLSRFQDLKAEFVKVKTKVAEVKADISSLRRDVDGLNLKVSKLGARFTNSMARGNDLLTKVQNEKGEYPASPFPATWDDLRARRALQFQSAGSAQKRNHDIDVVSWLCPRLRHRNGEGTCWRPDGIEPPRTVPVMVAVSVVI
jgi:hypothetical protein